MIWLMTAALAQDRYPRMAPVNLADGEGVWRVRIPPELRSPEDPDDGTDLLLVDAAGEPVEVAWARGLGSPRSVSGRVSLTPDADVIEVLLPEYVDRLEVQLDSGPAAATVQVFSGDTPISAPTLIWEHSQGQQREVVLTGSVRGTVRLKLTHHHRATSVRVRGWRDPSPAVRPDTLTVPVSEWQLGEDGWARYTVNLPAPLPITSLALTASEGLFERRVGLVDSDGYIEEIGEIRRMRIGGVSVEHVEVPMSRTVLSDRLEIAVDAHGDAPLSVTAVTVSLEGVEMLVVDPTGGPFTLYGGAPPQEPLPSDLTFAVPELFRVARGPVGLGEVTANPAFLPPEIRSGLAAPSTPIALRDFSTVRTVTGSGLVRIPLDEAVLTHARSDLDDLRLIDAEGRQIPYLLERRAVDAHWVGLQTSRQEDGSTSRILVELTQPQVPISSITLTTEATLFSRRVTAWRARGQELEPLRSYEWHGADRPGELTLALDALVGETLVLTIDNGDDPPLPVEVGAVGWPRWELIAVLPDAGARLVYGSPQADAPIYDLALLGEDLRRRAAEPASLGPEETLKPPPASLWDRLALGAGLAGLVFGLVWLTVRLVRSVEEVAPEPQEGDV